MKRYLLDAGPLTALLQGRDGAVALMRPWVQNQEAATSILAYGEAVKYLRPKPNYPAPLDALHQLLKGVQPFFLTYPILRRYAQLRLHLRPHGQLIGDIDTLIAATALERHLTVVTLDGDFMRIPGLSVLHLTKQQLTAVLGPVDRRAAGLDARTPQTTPAPDSGPYDAARPGAVGFNRLPVGEPGN